MARKVVVVGSGAAGMAAAVAAATEGAEVTVLESAQLLGGTTAWSGGGIWIPLNKKATIPVVPDQEDDARRYLKNVSIGDADPDRLETYVKDGARVVAATEAKTALRWQHIEGYPDYHAELDGGRPDGRSLEIHPIQLAPDLLARIRPNPFGALPITINERVNNRSIQNQYGNRPLGIGDRDEVSPAEIERRQKEGIATTGRGLIGGLATALLEKRGSIRSGMRVTRLIQSGDAVTGVEVNGERFDGQVIIASGGFERNPSLVRNFLRGPMLAPGGAPSNLGDGLVMGMTAGAALANMSEAWWNGAMQVPGETVDGQPLYRLMFTERSLPGSLIVDGLGRRFADEASNYNDFGRSLQDFDPARFTYIRVPSWLVFDAQTRRNHKIGPLTGNEPDPAWLKKANSLDALAREIDVPASNLAASVERFNALAAAGKDEDFGRGSYAWDIASSGRNGAPSTLRPLAEAPYYAVQVLPGCLGTKGGLKINSDGQVQRADGSGSIPGLFAAGNASANLFGHAYPGAGSTIGPALVFGWRAGEFAAAG
jgi:succinate dehydrogenase/fumarate reductase flavoprotein subunit